MRAGGTQVVNVARKEEPDALSRPFDGRPTTSLSLTPEMIKETCLATFVIPKVVDLLVGVRVSQEDERRGLDLAGE